MAGRVRGGWGGGVAAIAGALLVSACGLRAVHHTVREGDSLYRIAQAYGVPYQDIVRANDLGEPGRLVVGQRLRIPGLRRSNLMPRARGGSAARAAGGDEDDATGFLWPVAGGTVTSPFGPRERTQHDGIDIQAPIGTPVVAARPGRVLFAGVMRGYGRLVIVEHADGFATVYAHNQRQLVRPGDLVRGGQPIATLGATGQTSGPHLHFEVRKDNVARNPLFFLPPTSVASRRGEGVL